MIKTHPGNALFLNQSKNILQVMEIIPVDRKPQPYPLTDSKAVADSCQSAVKSACLTPELIISLAQPVKTDPDVTYAKVFDPLGDSRSDQSTVRRKSSTYAFVSGILNKFKHIRANQRFTA